MFLNGLLFTTRSLFVLILPSTWSCPYSPLLAGVVLTLPSTWSCPYSPFLPIVVLILLFYLELSLFSSLPRVVLTLPFYLELSLPSPSTWNCPYFPLYLELSSLSMYWSESMAAEPRTTSLPPPVGCLYRASTGRSCAL